MISSILVYRGKIRLIIYDKPEKINQITMIKNNYSVIYLKVNKKNLIEMLRCTVSILSNDYSETEKFDQK